MFILPSYGQAPTKLCMTTNGTNCIEITPSYPFAVYQGGNSFVNITTATDTNVKATPGVLVGVQVNVGGAGSSAALYNDADGTCSSGLIATISTASIATFTFNANATVGICVTTSGGTPANITVLYR